MPSPTAETRAPGARAGRRSVIGRWALAAALAAAGAVAGCGGGGGVDSGGTGVGMPAPQSAATGPIAGFGSLVVAGVHYDESAAMITDEDHQPVAAAALQLGMTVQIQGGAVGDVAGVPRATAQSIVVGEALVGPVTAVDPVACTATVLGLRVAATGSTVLDAGVPLPASGSCRLAAVPLGAVMGVHGSWDAAQQRLVASRVDLRPAAAGYLIKAPVERYDAATALLTLRGQGISLSALPALPADLSVGSVLRLRLRTTPSQGHWVAVAARTAAAASTALPAVARMELAGRITQYSSAQRFSVDDVAVDASQASFPQGTAGLGLGAKVELVGRPQGATLVASTVQVDGGDEQSDASVEIEGTVSAVDPVAQTFVVRGTTISYGGSPAYEGGNAASLAAGRKVAVTGHLAPSGTQVIADTIHIED